MVHHADFLAGLQVGDRVGFYRSLCGTLTREGFGEITKFDGYGHIIVMPERQTGAGLVSKVFDRHGREREEHCACNLCPADRLEELSARQEARNTKRQAVQYLIEYISGRRCGNGHYEIEEEHKEQIKKLVDLI